MAKRPGRKRNYKVTVIPAVAKVEEPILDKTAYWKGVEVRDRVIDNKAVSLVSRETAVEVALAGIGGEEGKRLARTAEEWVRLWGLCRRYYSDAPPIVPKVSSINRSQGHEGELNDGIISFGRQCHLRYQDAVRAVAGDPPTKEGRLLISALISICVENKLPTDLGKTRGVEALKLVADHWRF